MIKCSKQRMTQRHEPVIDADRSHSSTALVCSLLLTCSVCDDACACAHAIIASTHSATMSSADRERRMAIRSLESIGMTTSEAAEPKAKGKGQVGFAFGVTRLSRFSLCLLLLAISIHFIQQTTNDNAHDCTPIVSPPHSLTHLFSLRRTICRTPPPTRPPSDDDRAES